MGMGETNEYQFVIVFAMVKCCTTQISILPEAHKVFWWGVMAPLLLLHSFHGIQIKPFNLAAGSGAKRGYSWGYGPGYARDPL